MHRRCSLRPPYPHRVHPTTATITRCYPSNDLPLWITGVNAGRFTHHPSLCLRPAAHPPYLHALFSITDPLLRHGFSGRPRIHHCGRSSHKHRHDLHGGRRWRRLRPRWAESPLLTGRRVLPRDGCGRLIHIWRQPPISVRQSAPRRVAVPWCSRAVCPRCRAGHGPSSLLQARVLHLRRLRGCPELAQPL
jgi:hypothetical protein